MRGDIIAAVATPPGYGGIAIVRMSGGGSLEIAEKLFTNADQLRHNPRLMVYGRIEYKDEILDEVLAVYFKAPKSYTAEDVVEIHCHGGYQSASRIMGAALAEGARLAEKGEFTKRAFLNGRIDLAKAQGVIDAINAKTPLSHKTAQSALSGKLSQKIDAIYNMLLDDLSKLGVEIDFPEEGNPELTYEELESSINAELSEIKKLIDSYDEGKLIKDGLNISIVGRPNAGKSSLLNALLNEERAIVTDIAGTTRDAIKESFIISGMPVNIIDTAGIRNTDDEIEKIGVSKSMDYMENADVALLIIDASKDLSGEDRALIEKLKSKKHIILLNKSDLRVQITPELIEKTAGQRAIMISAKTGKGLEQLKDAIISLAIDTKLDPNEDIIITSQEQKNLLQNAVKSLTDAQKSVEERASFDMIEIDYKMAAEYIGLITGKTVSEEILDTMFSKFCIGK